MSKVLVDDSSLSGIGSAIRSKNGSSTYYKPSEMAAAINAIDTGGITPTGSITITENGTVDVTQYASAAVAVPNSYSAGDEGKVVSGGALVAQTARAAEITQNGTYDTTKNNSVIVNVSSGGDGDDSFTLTDYIESSGTQWINTGYSVQDNTRFEVVADVSTTQNKYSTIFGTRSVNNDYASAQACIIAANWNNNLYGNIDWGRGSTSYTNFDKGHKTKYVFKRGSYFIDIKDVGISANVFTSSYSATDQPLFIFTLGVNGSDYGDVTHCNMKLYRFRIYEGDTLVHEFVPWTDGNDVVCLKDTVTGNLKYNQGTGVFVRGTDS